MCSYSKEVIFINDSINDVLFALLNLRRNDVERIDSADGFISVTLAKKKTFCPKCNGLMAANGFYSRKLTVSVKAFEGIEVRLKVRRYRCLKCGLNSSDINHMSPSNKKISYSSVFQIMELLKSPKMTFKEVSNITGIPLSSVIRIFDDNCHIPRKTLPEVMCIDEVYTKNSDYKSKYSCIFYDFFNSTLVDVLPSRKKDYLHYYMKYIPLNERNNVHYICIDMYETYRTIARQYFKKAILCVDSFHVVKHINDDLQNVRIRIMKKYDYSSQEYYLLKNFRFLLSDQTVNLNGNKKYNRKLDRYLNYGDILELLLSVSDELRRAYELKEEYRIFNATFSKEEAVDNYDALLNDFIQADIREYDEFITLLKNWRNEIINSFIRINGRRINNGVAESINQNIAALIYNTKGIRNNQRRRKRIMYAINKDGFNLY